MTIRSHPLRSALSEEMHVRRFPRFAAPHRLVQLLTLVTEDQSSVALEYIQDLALKGREIVPMTAKYGVFAVGDITLVWERHTEFASYTLIRAGSLEVSFDEHEFDPILSEIFETLPGELVRATQVAVVPAGEMANPIPEALDRWFEDDALILCDVADGLARMISDFRLGADGYGRLLVLDRGLQHDELSQVVLRLQELGNYRKMALFGLPLAQRLTPQLTELETRLAELTHSVSERTTEDDKLLDELTFLSAELARLAAETRYRMSATRAYAQLVAERLVKLQIAPVRGYQTLADFTERRLMPAVRTCDSFSARIEDLLQRAAWTSELLRTRIDIALAKQNRDLLTSMDRRNQTQLRLQQAVEGLSVVAITYYLVALFAYVAKAFTGNDADRLTALSVPAVLIAVAVILIAVKRRIRLPPPS